MMPDYSDLFVYQYPAEAFAHASTIPIVGRRYHAGAIVLAWRWHDDDHIDFLLVEDEEERPFVAVRVHADTLDVRHDLWREDTVRYALIAWEND